MNLVILHVLNVAIYVWNAYQIAQHAQNVIHHKIEHLIKGNVNAILVILMMII